MSDPKLAAQLQIQSPGDVWHSKPVNTDVSAATGSDPSGYARAIVQDGRVVRTETGKAVFGNSGTVIAEANAAQSVPYEYALHPTTRCPVPPDRVTDDTILYFPGRGELKARDARSLGWLAAASSPLAGSQPQQQELSQPGQQEAQSDETPDELKVDLLPDLAVDQAYSSLIDNTRGAEQMAAINEVVQNGEVSARTLGTLASQLRCEPSELEATIAPIMAAFEQQARAVMSEGGLDSNDVVAFAQRNHPEKLREAMNRQATLRQAGGYGELRQMYLEGLAEHNPALALNADLGQGITQRQDNKGRVIVRLADGVEMEWRTAIRAFGPGK